MLGERKRTVGEGSVHMKKRECLKPASAAFYLKSPAVWKHYSKGERNDLNKHQLFLK